MWDARRWRDVVSGKDRSWKAAGLRLALAATEPFVTAGVLWRNRRYDRGRAAIHDVGVPVISVGNITLGGTGKTPMTAWLCRWFRRHLVRTAVVSRGYGAEAGAVNDEAAVLELQLPDVPHLQDPDRVAAARTAVEELASQLIVLDDAFQHRRLARALDIVMLDALEPFGLGHVFPRGMLREPLGSLARADVIVLSRADQISADETERIRRRVLRYAPHALWAESRHVPAAVLRIGREPAPVHELQGKRLAAFCGIGNPAAFRKTLSDLRLEMVAFREFPDHHRYRREDFADLSRWAAANGAEMVLCTEKDWVKIRSPGLGGFQPAALRIELEFTVGQADLERRLEEILATVRSREEREEEQSEASPGDP
ncbi:MAG: tetraacyldisaccharide 4'-kinase [Thermogutta sp.]|nr:tetraacyldisaccharide 4'-kinase [Thermogutta sp.]